MTCVVRISEYVEMINIEMINIVELNSKRTQKNDAY